LGLHKSTRVQALAAILLHSLALENAENKVKIRSSGAIAALNRLLSARAIDKSVKSEARAALGMMTG
jgi:hypothetical protein